MELTRRIAHRSIYLTSAFFLTYFTTALAATAQIVPDKTLPVNSTVTTTGQLHTIDGGTTRGVNLYHSFQDFSVPTNNTAYFNNAPQVQNILTRVTGSTASDVDGTIRANGNANLYLLNPNGITFGQNAKLEIGGSFTGSTGSSFKFPDGSEFSAKNPQAPPLLTMSITPGVQYGQTDPRSMVTNAGSLTVREGQGIALQGGTVSSTGVLTAPSGTVQVLGNQVSLLNNARIDVSGTNGGGTVLVGGDYQGKGTVPNAQQTFIDRGVTINADALQNGNGGKVIIWADKLTEFYGSVTARGANLSDKKTVGDGGFTEISGKQNLYFDGKVDLRAANGKLGTLLLDPTDVIISNGSTPGTTLLEAVLENTLTTTNVSLDATNDIIIGGLADGLLKSTLGSITFQADSDGDNVGSFSMNPGNTIKTYGQDVAISGANATISGGGIDTQKELGQTNGNNGNVTIAATGSITFDNNSHIFTDVNGVVGNAGDINLSARNISFTNGAQVQADTFGTGNAGEITIAAIDSVLFSGSLSGASSNVNKNGLGNAGSVTINARTISILDGATLGSSVRDLAKGNAGTITLKATDTVLLSGVSPQRPLGYSAALSIVEELGVGNAGNVIIDARSVSILDGARLSSEVFGQGKGGEISITAKDNVLFSGSSLGFLSSAFTDVNTSGVGNAGNIIVKARSVSVTNGAQIASEIYGIGNAGNIKINAVENVLISGSPSGLFSRVREQAVGEGGTISIKAQALNVQNGGQITASTSSSGKAGTIEILLGSSLIVNGTGSIISATTDRGSTGKGGDIFIDPQVITLQNGAKIAVGSQGSGIGGNITIFSNILTLLNGSSITAETASTNGGNITLNIPAYLLLRYGSQISTTAGTALAGGNGGNININAGFIIGVKGENSDIFANAFTGNGGNVNITTNAIFGLEFRPKLTSFSDITASSQFGLQGSVLVTTPGLDPSRGLTTLPLNLTDPTKQVSQSCAIGGKLANRDNRFTISGKGGLPKSPTDELSSIHPLVELADLVPSSTNSISATEQKQEVTQEVPKRIIEANTLVRDSEGVLHLVAASNPLSPAIPQLVCP
ncbi:filamentous hemagglutinin N-terminal domain-containing protein [Tumidithrix elongata RA019]|uniref:Filamentous hemagglutinin N-terminal domain-containing protein n=1 Tax=Tumidithrix elongata BACA0141 TaxID=2716417 RepID=A0AAW9PYS5_9CYAN|nr:filamentous hemagglutinin N-terminal domain-containing protein [Tumidithrix elongata RA019]